MKIVVSNMPFMESVAVGIFVTVGGRYENRHSCGMSHIIEHLLFKGTRKRSALELKEAIEGVGGSFNAFTSEECTCLLCKIPSKHADLGFDILSDMILNPRMDPSDIEKEKLVILEEIKMYRDQPAHEVQDILAEIMWPRHPLGMPLAGYEKTVKGFDRRRITTFKKGYYVPQNISVVACGRIKEDRFRRRIRGVFPKSRGKKKAGFTLFKNRQRYPSFRVHDRDTEQTQLAFGFHSFRRNHPDRYARAVMNVILGASMSSRLFEELREKRGLCYDIGTSAKGYEETGAFMVHAGVDNKKVRESAAAITRELIKLKKEPVTPQELERSKEFLKGQLSLLLEDTASRMLWLGERVISDEDIPKVSDIMKKVDRVTPSAISRVANATFNRRNANLACVGPINKKAKDRIKRTLDEL